MNATLPAWISKLAAVALLAGLLAACYLFVVAPLNGAYQETNQAIVDGRDQILGFQKVAASRSAFQSQLEQLKKRQSSTGYYLAGGTNALAGAALQELVSDAIEKSGGTLRSVQILPGESEGDFQKVAVRVQFITTTSVLFKILYGLESGQTYLFIDNLDVRAQRSRRRRNQETPQEPQLQVRFDLTGYQRPEAG